MWSCLVLVLDGRWQRVVGWPSNVDYRLASGPDMINSYTAQLVVCSLQERLTTVLWENETTAKILLNSHIIRKSDWALPSRGVAAQDASSADKFNMNLHNLITSYTGSGEE